jgi:heme/copper-type cytochrome/quinol oxidase subunit 3
MISSAILASQAELIVLRRVAERGLKRAQEREDSEFVDIFQHMLDEIWWVTDDPEDDIN